MNITETQGDVFKVAATLNPPAVAHGVNTRGVMGAGVAKTVHAYWPELYKEYRALCLGGKLIAGGMYPYQTSNGGWVYNLASQDNLGRNARLSWVEESAIAMTKHAELQGITRIASVRIGCGIGGLSWKQVREVLAKVDSSVELVVVEYKV
jgi:O-acetyl-ADP-ribose deacetylase (regulator of RNase III)